MPKLNILILSNSGQYIKKNKLDTVNNISAVYGHFYFNNFIKYFRKHKLDIKTNIESMSFSSKLKDIYDFCFIMYNRGTTVLNDEEFNNLRKHIKNEIFTISPTSKITGKEDFLLHYVGKEKKNSFKINWTADHNALKSQQNNVKKIRILVDHKYYGRKGTRISKNDKTEEIVKSLLEYKKKNDNIEIIQINTGNENGFSFINELKDIDDYDRKTATSYKNIYEIYKTSSIFAVTHEECMGISTLECNMAGCYVVMPNDYIKPEFSKYLDFSNLNNIEEFNWDELITKLNPEKTRKKVLHLTFENAIDKIYNKFIKKHYK